MEFIGTSLIESLLIVRQKAVSICTQFVRVVAKGVKGGGGGGGCTLHHPPPVLDLSAQTSSRPSFEDEN